MAAPIIASITATPSTVAPGGAFVVTIVASDPDARQAMLVGRVTDSQGNVAEIQGQVTISDPLAYELLDLDAVGFTIAQRAGQPNVFDCRAP